MKSFKTMILRALQNRSASLLQPLYNSQEALRSEVDARAIEASHNSMVLAQKLAELSTSVLASRWVQHPRLIASREEIGYWLNWQGLAGDGVEVGVYLGEFSAKLLGTWEGRRLFSIDPWREFPGDEYVDILNTAQDQQDRNFSEAQKRLRPFGERSVVLRQTSAEAAAGFADGSLDFVYLDAQHHYEALRDDIALWRPKVKSGGVLAGHDYLDGVLPSGLYGVKTAVDEFVRTSGSELIVTREPVYPSWLTLLP